MGLKFFSLSLFCWARVLSARARWSCGLSRVRSRSIKSRRLEPPFLTQTVGLDDLTVRFEIWDTAGQERYHSLAPMYYRGAQAAVVVYDITSIESFERAQAWVKELQRQGNPNIVVALAGNKLDRAEARQVDIATAQAYAKENGILWMETSAKTAVNVNELFLAIAQKLPKTSAGPASGGKQPSKVDLAQQPQAQQKSGCCG